MKCVSPILMKNKYTGKLQRVSCGQCIHCRINHSRQWSIRIAHEQLKYGDKSCFLTLTYDDEHLPADHSVHKEHVQKFLKRLRKQLGVEKVRYFACGEYGERGKLYGLVNGRPHYHMILFGVPVDSLIFKNRHVHYEKGKPCGWHADLDSWRDPKTKEYLGKVHVGSVTPESANYVAGYILKKVKGKHAKEFYETLGVEPEFALMSTRPGIGADYLMSHHDYYSKHRYVTMKGVKYSLPRYYIDRIEEYKMSKDERRKQLLRRGVFPDEVERFMYLQDQGCDPFDDYESLAQSEKNTKARLSLRS